MKHAGALLIAASALALLPAEAQAQSTAELQRQIDELRTEVRALTQALAAQAQAQRLAQANASSSGAPSSLMTAATPPAAPVLASAAPPPVATAPAAAKQKGWYDRLKLRGYTQMRVNEIVSGDATAPAGRSRLRSVHDSGISDRSNFSLRRTRLVLEGEINDRLSLYLQSDFSTAVNNQSGTERREGFAQLRDAYVDWYLDKDKRIKLRLGQSKVPVGWENLQSSSNRVPLDRSDAINSAVPGERDLGLVAYYTPAHVQQIWDRLAKDGQKLFGNYGAFGLGAWNGQGINRTEQDNSLMITAMATWPFELGDQVVELGASGMINRVRPEVRSGGVNAASIQDDRIGVHAMLYPQPFGVQAEWAWGKGPQFNTITQQIEAAPLAGGYIQLMYRIKDTPVGPVTAYGRWQRYRGGWKAAVNAPRLETDEFELGLEFTPIKSLEFTAAYARMKRAEADERRTGRAEGDVLRAQVQWSY